MAETVDEAVNVGEEQPPTTSLCLCEQYVRVTEGGALTAARWLGRADQEAAERDAAEAMHAVLSDFPIRGRVVIGSAMEDSRFAPDRTSVPAVRPSILHSIRSKAAASSRVAATAPCR
jgi:hypothetical protein